jgi:nitrite reductase (NADH) small subunit
MPAFVKVAAVADIPTGTVREVEANGKKIAVANVEGQFYALDNTCLHRGGPIGQGALEGNAVECPWHGWQYDMKTGQCAFNPAAKLPTYEVKVEGADVLVAA